MPATVSSGDRAGPSFLVTRAPIRPAWHDGPVIIPKEIDDYAAAHSSPEPEYLAALAAETREFTDSHGMMVGPLEGQFLAMLVTLTKARRILEIGTFTGYSALSMVAAMAEPASVVTCEIDPERAAMARRHFDASPYGSRIDLYVGPALDTIADLPGPFDLVFIDADKTNYTNYYEAVLDKLAAEGVILVDNVLWSGKVLDDEDQSDDTKAIRAFNDHVAADPRVVSVMLTIRDGITLIRRA
jgi:caffeoyl-CoA O-methyltransferase